MQCRREVFRWITRYNTRRRHLRDQLPVAEGFRGHGLGYYRGACCLINLACPPSGGQVLAKHSRFHMHFTPTYSSWLNQVERLFAEVTRELLQRSDHRSVQALEKDLRDWVRAWNEDPQPFIWTKTAEEILASIARYLKRINGAGH